MIDHALGDVTPIFAGNGRQERCISPYSFIG